MNRSLVLALCLACGIVLLFAGCSRKGPVSVRFARDVDEAKLDELPKLGGSVALLIDAEFWSDREKVRRIPIARREKTFIIGPGAAAMAERMLSRMFDDVVRIRRRDASAPPIGYDHVIRLVHESFDDRTLMLPLFSRQRYRVGLGAEVSGLDGSLVDEASALGSESFWLMNLAAANPWEGDARLLARAARTLNAAVQESLFELMDELASLPVFEKPRP